MVKILNMSDSIIKLFHGSKSGIKGAISPVSRTLCDFGKGFYMGTEKDQPMTLICNYENAVLYELELDTTNLIVKDIPLNIEWALFVAFNSLNLQFLSFWLHCILVDICGLISWTALPDLCDYFLSQVRELFSYYVLNIILSPFLSPPSGIIIC